MPATTGTRNVIATRAAAITAMTARTMTAISIAVSGATTRAASGEGGGASLTDRIAALSGTLVGPLVMVSPFFVLNRSGMRWAGQSGTALTIRSARTATRNGCAPVMNIYRRAISATRGNCRWQD